MANQIVDERDQDFVLYEMLDIEKLCTTECFQDFSREVFEMTLDVARKLAVDEVFPTLQEADEEGCRFEDGNVYVPKCFHHLQELFKEGGWAVISKSQEAGGLGMPYLIDVACTEGFVHNFAFLSYPFLAAGAGHLVEVYGTEEQKEKYMRKMYAGEWGGSMALTEPEAGSDVGNLKTKAIKQPDGSYRLVGSKIFITSAESDVFENIINPVLARIEGDPSGTKGISLFLVPKYLVNDDGTLGERNDYSISGIEHKMGIKGSSTCQINFGDNGNCYAELLGEQCKGMRIMFQMMNEARIGVGVQGLGAASIAYLHALNYARERKQGANLMNLQNPDAPRAIIIEHPDVRRMLLWMKSQVEGMRALVYYCALCLDRAEAFEEGEEKEKWHGFLELLTPICKSYCSDFGFRVTELAIQVYGGYGYCKDYPVEQFMRDEKIASIYEGTNGIQALDLVGRKLAQKGGQNFVKFLDEMKKTIETYKDFAGHADLAEEVQSTVDLLGEVGSYFAQCGKEGKFLIPVSNAYPFLNMMGTICLAWLLFWQSGIATQKLDAIYKEKGIDPADKEKLNAFLGENRDAAFYSGKVHAARYFIKNILPEAEAYAKGIRSEDLSVMEIHEEGFSLS